MTVGRRAQRYSVRAFCRAYPNGRASFGSVRAGTRPRIPILEESKDGIATGLIE